MWKHGGAASLLSAQAHDEGVSQFGAEIAEADLAHLQQQAEVLQDSLSKFAAKYRKQINADAEFRRHFAVACAAAGVDPLASNKASWGRLLGMGDFYFALGVQVVDVCMAARQTTGALLPLPEAMHRLTRLRGAHASPVTVDDVQRALEALAPLGQGITLTTLAGKRYLVGTQQGLSQDTATVLDLALQRGAGVADSAVTLPPTPSLTSCPARLTTADVTSALGWAAARARSALVALLEEELAWLDLTIAPSGQRLEVYWFPGLQPAAAPSAANPPPVASHTPHSLPSSTAAAEEDEGAEATPALASPASLPPGSQSGAGALSPALPAAPASAAAGGTRAPATAPTPPAAPTSPTPSRGTAPPPARSMGGLTSLLQSGDIDLAAMRAKKLAAMQRGGRGW